MKDDHKIDTRLAGILADPERAHNIPREELPHLMAELKRVEVMLQLGLKGTTGHENPPKPPKQENWLTAEEAAKRLKVSKRWVYRHSPKWRFAKRISHKKLLISESGLTAWMAANKA